MEDTAQRGRWSQSLLMHDSRVGGFGSSSAAAIGVCVVNTLPARVARTVSQNDMLHRSRRARVSSNTAVVADYNSPSEGLRASRQGCYFPIFSMPRPSDWVSWPAPRGAMHLAGKIPTRQQ
jgi:hypothetical protein